jgi:uncharacterized protein
MSLPEKPVPPAGGIPSAEERQWALVAHLAGLVASALGGFAFLGPLIVWLIKKDQSAFVADQAKEALNFQIAVTIALLVSIGIAMATCVGAILIPIVAIGSLVFSIVAAVESNKGVYYRYPYSLRLIN